MTESSLVLVPFGNKCLALTRDQFREALERGRELVEGTTATPSGVNADAPERLHTAHEMEQRTNVKAAWYLEGARRGDIPHHRLGRYVRFKFDEVLKCSRFQERVK